MSLLTVVQYFCRRTNVPEPSTVIGTTDTQVKQIYSLLEEEGNDLAQRGAWQGITFEATHTTLAQEDQGAITSIATNGFRWIKNQTIWDRTLRLPVYGPLDAQDWQQTKAVQVSGPVPRFRIRGGKLLANPTPTAGNTWAFEYLSNNWILGANGTTYKQYFTLDTDTVLLPEALVMQGLRWRWKKEKGEDYAEDFRTYEMQVKNALGADGGKKVLYQDESGRRLTGGVVVPIGSWNV
jgi:hypothetical protein